MVRRSIKRRSKRGGSAQMNGICDPCGVTQASSPKTKPVSQVVEEGIGPGEGDRAAETPQTTRSKDVRRILPLDRRNESQDPSTFEAIAGTQQRMRSEGVSGILLNTEPDEDDVELSKLYHKINEEVFVKIYKANDDAYAQEYSEESVENFKSVIKNAKAWNKKNVTDKTIRSQVLVDIILIEFNHKIDAAYNQRDLDNFNSVIKEAREWVEINVTDEERKDGILYDFRSVETEFLKYMDQNQEMSYSDNIWNMINDALEEEDIRETIAIFEKAKELAKNMDDGGDRKKRTIEFIDENLDFYQRMASEDFYVEEGEGPTDDEKEFEKLLTEYYKIDEDPIIGSEAKGIQTNQKHLIGRKIEAYFKKQRDEIDANTDMGDEEKVDEKMDYVKRAYERIHELEKEENDKGNTNFEEYEDYSKDEIRVAKAVLSVYENFRETMAENKDLDPTNKTYLKRVNRHFETKYKDILVGGKKSKQSRRIRGGKKSKLGGKKSKQSRRIRGGNKSKQSKRNRSRRNRRQRTRRQ